MDDVAPLGVTRAMLRNAERLGQIKRLTRGVYVAVGPEIDDPAVAHIHGARAQQLRSPLLVASHGTAALACDVPTLDPRTTAIGKSHFTAEPDSTRRSLRVKSQGVV